MSTVSPWPAQEEDAARAVQFVRSKAEEYHIDPGKVAAIGGSAGAHIAMMLGMASDYANPDSDDPVERQSSRVHCVVQKAGPVDLETMFKAMMKDDDTPLESREKPNVPSVKILGLVGMSPEDFDSDEFYKRLREMSPIHNIRDDCPPIFIQYKTPEGMTSKDDPRLNWGAHRPISGCMREETLKERGLPYEIIMTPDLKNENNILSLWVQSRTIDFIKKHCNAKK